MLYKAQHLQFCFPEWTKKYYLFSITIFRLGEQSCDRLIYPKKHFSLSHQTLWLLLMQYSLCFFSHFLCAKLFTPSPPLLIISRLQNLFEDCIVSLCVRCSNHYFTATLSGRLTELLKSLQAELCLMDFCYYCPTARYVAVHGAGLALGCLCQRERHHECYISHPLNWYYETLVSSGRICQIFIPYCAHMM